MKKYLLGIVAVTLAIGLNAFTPVKKPVPETGKFVNYFWYNVNGTTTLGNCLNPGATVSKATAMTTLTSCPDNPLSQNCVAGSANGSLAAGSSISSPPADARIRHN